jgi:hypothetical protein
MNRSCRLSVVIPAKAGIQGSRFVTCPWTPAFAGATKGEAFVRNMF